MGYYEDEDEDVKKFTLVMDIMCGVLGSIMITATKSNHVSTG